MGRSLVRMLIVSTAAVGMIVGAGGCHFSFNTSSAREVDKHALENEIVSKMTGGIKPSSVTCPSGLPAKVGAEVICKMKIDVAPNDVNVIASVTGVEGKTVKYNFKKSVEADRVAKLISDKLNADSGRNDSVTCPEDLKGYEGAKLVCQLSRAGKTYAVNVTVTDASGPLVDFNVKVDNRPQ